MGSALGEKFVCQDVSKDEYMGLRTQGWNFNQGYLYQTEVEHSRQQKLKVFTYQLNLKERQTQSYFQRLNMMSKYLNKGNIHLPLLCMSERQDCSCIVIDKTITKIYYESYDVSMGDQIKARYRQREIFREEQIWYLLYCVINGLRQFQPFVEPSGNITTQDILMNGKGQIKIRVSLSSPHQRPRNSLFHNYFAPQELDMMSQIHLQEGTLTRLMYKQFNINPNICQVYSLGVSILVIATGNNHLNFYSPPYGINKKTLCNQLNKLPALGYSKLLTNLIKIMLTQYKNRPLPSQIRQIFKQFEPQILNFQQFSLNLADSSIGCTL